MNDTVDRIKLSPRRIERLFQKYPVVGILLVLSGFVVGFFIGLLL